MIDFFAWFRFRLFGFLFDLIDPHHRYHPINKIMMINCIKFMSMVARQDIENPFIKMKHNWLNIISFFALFYFNSCGMP